MTVRKTTYTKGNVEREDVDVQFREESIEAEVEAGAGAGAQAEEEEERLMVNLRELAEADLSESLEDSASGFGLPVELIGPDGTVYTDLTGQVLYDTVRTTEEGTPIIVHKPVVTLRRSSLTRVPLPSDRPRWACKIPLTPDRTAELETYIVEEPVESGGTFGFIRLYLTRAEQAT